MRRKHRIIRNYEPDAIYKSSIATKFVNHLMKEGKKSVALAAFYRAMDIIKEETKQDPITIFDLALENVGPALEVKSKRVGGANYQVPTPVNAERRMTLAFRWILNAVRSKKGQPIAKKLAAELIAASKNEGTAIKKKLDTHRMAEANRAFAHFSF
ncbi:MAG: 30S ribosomal protein S7 [Candidatus Parcubacteria bacterium]|nr:30S ribosomal protein S7 [Candidatus Parcubacteria bacterium]